MGLDGIEAEQKEPENFCALSRDPAIFRKIAKCRHAGVKDAAVSWRAARQKTDILKLVGSRAVCQLTESLDTMRCYVR